MPKPLAPNNSHQYHLRVYADHSELFLADGICTVFNEGGSTPATQARYKAIIEALEQGFLKEQIHLCKKQAEPPSLGEQHQAILAKLADSVTSEVGRALVGLTILQLAIKAIAPEQNIRLHKSGNRSQQFGWKDGISMRVLDKKYITPVLRAEGLLKLNADGFMMTRSLAENYPYSKVYKAAIRGGREEWLSVVDDLESRKIAPLAALQYLLAKLLNHAAQFIVLAEHSLTQLINIISTHDIDHQFALRLIWQHINLSTYSPRLMEIAMHALFQALEEIDAIGDAEVVPLSQMRSANKKHGNIGDVELRENGHIIEAWDAKYGKTYLRDELEELNDKLQFHEHTIRVGFVTSEPSIKLSELQARIAEIEDIHNTHIHILTLDQWVEHQTRGIQDSSLLAQHWLTAYTESLAQRRLDKAPIDEPCFQWLQEWHNILQTSATPV